MHRVSLGIIFIVALCTATLLHAEPGHCFFEPRPCEDWNDSSHAEKLPDSLRMTLQEKLDSDTGFVFWGNAEKIETLAEQSFFNGKIYSWLNKTITTEQERNFYSWYKKEYDLSQSKLDSVPPDLKRAFTNASNSTWYVLIKVEYRIKKIYDRHTKTWKDPEADADTISRTYLVHSGPVLATNPPKLLADFSTEGVHPALERIFFEDGHSRVIESDEFKAIDSIAKLPVSFLPNRYTIETYKNMSLVYKERIKEALAMGDKEAIRLNTAKLDSFLVSAENRFFYSRPSDFNCNTKRLFSVYMGTFEDYTDCGYYSTPYADDEEVAIHTMLQDSLRAMYHSGELEKALSDRSSSDRAFWRVFAASLASNDQSEMNGLIQASADSIKKIEPWNFITDYFYVDYGVVWNIQWGIGGGISWGLGDAYSYDFAHNPTFDLSLEFFYKKFGGGYNSRIIKSDYFNDNKYQNLFLIDIYAGYRTFSTSYIDNRIYIGPTILISDLQEKDVAEPLKTHGGIGLHFGTAFDFYFSKYKDDGHFRVGLRLIASISNYYTNIVKDSDGGLVTVTLTPLLQFYDRSKLKYGEPR